MPPPAASSPRAPWSMPPFSRATSPSRPRPRAAASPVVPRCPGNCPSGAPKVVGLVLASPPA
eukprot:9477876-Prorocentrum_lima.AAC.1